MEVEMAKIKEEIAEVVQELETKLPIIMDELEDLKATWGVLPPEHDARDRSMVKKDLSFTLRQYLGNDESTCLDHSGRNSPSFQVSSFLWRK